MGIGFISPSIMSLVCLSRLLKHCDFIIFLRLNNIPLYTSSMLSLPLLMLWCGLLHVVEVGSCYTAQANLKLAIHLASTFWVVGWYVCVTTHSVCHSFLEYLDCFNILVITNNATLCAEVKILVPFICVVAQMRDCWVENKMILL